MAQIPPQPLSNLGRSTSYQRGAIRALLRRAGFPTNIVTLAHRQIFADIPGARLGRDIDATLNEISMVRADRLIKELQEGMRNKGVYKL